jgi:hypothetical protein
MTLHSDVFLSYAAADRLIAERLANVLRARGWAVWWDRRIPPGKTWADVIEYAITGSRCVIVLWSKASVASQWVKKEARFAESKECLIPAAIEAVGIPFEFNHLQAADLVEWVGADTEGLKHLMAELQFRLGSPVSSLATSQLRPSPTEMQQPRRRAEKVTQGTQAYVELKSLFPLFDIVLGETSVSQIARMGSRTGTIDDDTGEPYLCYEVDGFNFWYDEETEVVNHMYLVNSDPLPSAWEALGLDWRKSYMGWLAFLPTLGYVVSIEEEPHIAIFKGHKSLSAIVLGVRHGRYPHGLRLEFDYGDGTTVKSPKTLYSITVKVLD